MTRSEASPQIIVESLTRCNCQGVRYQRNAAVEAQIKVALALDTPDLVARACLSDATDPHYLQEETLAYLTRRAHRAGDDDMVNGLVEVFVERCTRFLKGQLAALGRDQLQEAVAEVIADLFELLAEPDDSDRGDFLQVRFWVVVKRLGIAAFNRAVAESRRNSLLVALEPTGAASEDELDRPIEIADAVTPAADTRLLIDEALASLDPNLRQAYVMKVEGWPVEDRDPTLMTISKYFGKTSRTIRNWISEAEKQLEDWRNQEEAGS